MTIVFFSYSHKDETLRDELQTHLSLLQRQGKISTWHDRRIGAGEEVDEVIMKQLDEADIILLLISSDFVNSNYCWGVEVHRAMERHEAKEAVVIPIILRSCLWQEAPFGKLLAAPTDGRPVTRWPDRDEAFLNVASMLRDVVNNLETRKRTPISNPQQIAATSIAPRSNVPRSSNLAIHKTFSEHDKDNFRHDAFDYIQKYFEASLHALSDRNSEITTRFRSLDANRFTAVAYRDGKKVTACSISMGGGFLGGGINYLSNDSGETNSSNGGLQVEAEDNGLHLKPWFDMSSDKERKFTFEGGAEYLWERFLEPLQRSR